MKSHSIKCSKQVNLLKKLKLDNMNIGNINNMLDTTRSVTISPCALLLCKKIANNCNSNEIDNVIRLLNNGNKKIDSILKMKNKRSKLSKPILSSETSTNKNENDISYLKDLDTSTHSKMSEKQKIDNYEKTSEINNDNSSASDDSNSNQADTSFDLVISFLQYQQLINANPPLENKWALLKSEMFFSKDVVISWQICNCALKVFNHFHCKYCNTTCISNDQLKNHLIKHKVYVDDNDYNLVNEWENLNNYDICYILLLKKFILNNSVKFYEQASFISNQATLFKREFLASS